MFFPSRMILGRHCPPACPRSDRGDRHARSASRIRRTLASLLVAPALLSLLLLSGLSAHATPLDDSEGDSSEPRWGRRANVAREHIENNCDELGLELQDVDDIESREHESRHTETTHLNFRQRVNGIPINGANMGLAVDRRGRVFGRWSDFIPGADGKANRRRPVLSADEALIEVAFQLDLPIPDDIEFLGNPRGPQTQITMAGGNVSRDPIPAKLVYQPFEDGLRLAWDIVIRTPDGLHWWNLQVDAENGDILAQSDWISHETYKVFGPPPILTPDEGAHIITSPPTLTADPIASPLGWHDANGVPGADFTDTRGNNVYAQEDADANDVGGFRPVGGPNLIFEFPLNLSHDPSTYRSASITNLYYWVNIAHDVFYQYGFDEASGNFQLHNYGRGGLGADPVVADAQDGASIDNASFGAPPDGFAGRLEMFLFTAPVRLEVTAPAGIADFYIAGSAQFGPAPPTTPIDGEIVLALDSADGLGPSTTDGCTELSNDGAIDGNIALIDRGSCNFTDKVINAQNAGATAVIVANNVGDALLTMGGTDPSITIPALFIGQSDGATIRSAPGPVAGSVSSSPMRDGALDAGIIIHEFGHGVTSRLTGGASNANCLVEAQSEGMGEGWSDFFTLFFGAESGDTGGQRKPIGTYVLGQSEATGSGIRSQPYSTNMAINTHTLADITTLPAPHGMGEVWAVTLWEIFWELVGANGFDPDIYNGSGGNNLALQLVIDGLKIQPCNPTFIEARDAILTAEDNATAGANSCLLWRGFAKRGLGDGASVSTDPSLLAPAEDFTLPAECAEFCADGNLAASEQCDDTNLIDLDGCSRTCRIEESYPFRGVAQGGNVQLIVEGQSVSISTLPGETPTDVAAKLAEAVTTHPVLSGMGVVATGDGDTIVVSGSIDSIDISDPGLAHAVPLSDWFAPIIALLLLISGFFWINTSQRGQHGGSISQ